MEPKVKKRHGCLIPCIVIFIIFAGLIGIVINAVVPGNYDEMEKSLLAETMELSDLQEQDMLEIFDACGIVEIKEVTQFQAGTEHTSYHVRDEETNHYQGMGGNIVVWVSNNSKTIEAIYFNDQDIYVDGIVVAPVSDYYVSSAQRDQYRVDVQFLVKEVLNYPDTAKFGSASAWAFGVKDGYDVIQSSVTAQNAFGVESTENFQVKVDRSTGTVVSFIMGGTEYITE